MRTHLRLLPTALLATLLVVPHGTAAQAPLHMTEPRALHSATPLADGRVLLAGGFRRNGELLGSAELFDHRTGGFTATRPMPEPRMGHSATLLRSGRVLVAGGRGGEARRQSEITASALLFDPVSGTFTPAGRMTTPRADHTATLLRDGQVLLVGGDAHGEQATASAEVYDPVSGTFTAVSPMARARTYHAAALLRDGRVLVVGGGPDLATVLAGAEAFDPATGRFAQLTPMATPRRKLAAVTLADGRVLVAGGAGADDYAGALRTVELFDAETGRFEAGPSMRAGRFKIEGAAAPVASGAVIAGGAPGLERFDARAGSFTLLAGGPAEPRYYATVTPLPSGAVLVAGGYGGRGVADDAAWVVSAE